MEFIRNYEPKTYQERRLENIKLRFIIKPKKCLCCGKTYGLEFMWYAHRYLKKVDGRRGESFDYYCRRCLPKRINVLHQIYRDDNLGGFIGVDGYGAGMRDFDTYKRIYRKGKNSNY